MYIIYFFYSFLDESLAGAIDYWNFKGKITLKDTVVFFVSFEEIVNRLFVSFVNNLYVVLFPLLKY